MFENTSVKREKKDYMRIDQLQRHQQLLQNDDDRSEISSVRGGNSRQSYQTKLKQKLSRKLDKAIGIPITLLPARVVVPSAEFVRNMTVASMNPEEKVATTLIESFSKIVLVSARHGKSHYDMKIPTWAHGTATFDPSKVILMVSRDLSLRGYFVEEIWKNKVLRIRWK